MQKKLTITLDETVYDGLYRVIGRRRISRFIEELVRPYILAQELEAAYEHMAQDENAADEPHWQGLCTGHAASRTGSAGATGLVRGTNQCFLVRQGLQLLDRQGRQRRNLGKAPGQTDVVHQSWAEQSAAPDCLQRPLVPRSRFRQQVSASVRCCAHSCEGRSVHWPAFQVSH